MTNDDNQIDVHDEHWWKHGRYQILCGEIKYAWVLKPSHTIKACVYSNHVKFWHIQTQIEEISTLATFTGHYVGPVHEICDGCIGSSLTFQENLNKDSKYGNDEWWQWDIHYERWCKHGQSQILCGNIRHPWVLKPSQNVKAFVLSNYIKFWRIQEKFEEIYTLDHSLLIVWGWWITFVMGGLEVPWHFKRVLTKLL